MKKFFSLRNILIFLGLVGVLVYWFFFRKQPIAISQNGQTKKIYLVDTRDLKSILSLSGKVDAEEKTVLQFAVSGKLAWVGVKEGDFVRKWQTLATLDQRDLQKTLEKKLYDFLGSRWDFDQNRDDYKGAYTGSGNTYITDKITRIADKTQFTLDKSVIDVELANLALEQGSLISPINGIVTRLDQPFSGVNVTPAGSRIEIVNPETIYLKALVDQQDIIKLKNNLKTDIVFDAFPNETHVGKITYSSFAPEVGEESSYLVKITIPEKTKNKLRLGMGAEITVNLQEKNNVLAIPVEALSDDGQKKWVYAVDKNNKLVKQDVVTGIETDEFFEIKKGLRKGSKIAY